jgi:FxsC-like protein
MSYLFFFSYARDDLIDMKRFYEDLVEEVRSETGQPRNAIGSIGFRDESNIEVGEPWPDELGRALNTAQVFVYLHSPSYFRREWCGKEWEHFRRRLDAEQTTRGLPQRRPRMLPILWVPFDNPPADAAPLQHSQKDLGEDYAREGIRFLLRLSRCQDQYREFLTRFAQRLIQVAKKDGPLADTLELPEFDKIPNAFQRPAPSAGGNTAVTADVGPRYATFVYVVARSGEIQEAGKARLDAYGGEDVDWRPFCPPTNSFVTRLAQKAVLKEDLNYERLLLSDNLVNDLLEAERKRKIIVILVDMWTLQLARYRQLMEQYDQHRFRSCVVLVPWNSHDPDIAAWAANLQRILRRTFSRQSGPTFRADIPSLERLEEEIGAALIASRKQILEHLDPAHRAQGAGEQTLPLISAVRSE